MFGHYNNSRFLNCNPVHQPVKKIFRRMQQHTYDHRNENCEKYDVTGINTDYRFQWIEGIFKWNKNSEHNQGLRRRFASANTIENLRFGGHTEYEEQTILKLKVYVRQFRTFHLSTFRELLRDLDRARCNTLAAQNAGDPVCSHTDWTHRSSPIVPTDKIWTPKSLTGEPFGPFSEIVLYHPTCPNITCTLYSLFPLEYPGKHNRRDGCFHDVACLAVSMRISPLFPVKYWK